MTRLILGFSLAVGLVPAAPVASQVMDASVQSPYYSFRHSLVIPGCYAGAKPIAEATIPGECK
jgi:hypothetical protein